MRWHSVFWIVSSLIQPLNAIFADEAYHIDYHHALVGIPQSPSTFFHRPQTSSNASLLYTISDKAVLGAVNPKDGSLLWRQALAGNFSQDTQGAFLITRELDGTLISGYGSSIACWDALTGVLFWSYNLPTPATILRLQPVPAVEGDSVQDIVVLTRPTPDDGPVTIWRIAGDGNGIKWQHSDSSAGSGASLSVATSVKNVYYIVNSHGMLSSSKAKVQVFDIKTGKESSQYSVAVDFEPLTSGGDYVVGSSSGSPFLLSSDSPYKTVKFNLLGSSKLSTITLEDKGEEIENLSVEYSGNSKSPIQFLIHARSKSRQWAEVFRVNAKSGDVTKVYSLPATEGNSVFTASSVGAGIYFVRITDTETTLYSSESASPLGSWPKVDVKPKSTGGINLHAVAEVVSRSNTFAIRVAECSSTGLWSLVRNGETVWTRPEALAHAEIAAWADEPIHDSLVDELEVEASVNPVTAYIHRLKRHAHDLAKLPEFLMKLPDLIMKPNDDGIDATRKSLIGTKLVLVGTSRHELFGLDATNSAEVKWYLDFSSVVPADSEIKYLTASNGRASLYISDGSFLLVDVLDGKLIEHQAGTVAAIRLVEIPGYPSSTIIKVDHAGMPHLAKDFAPSAAVEGNSLVTISETGIAFGWSIGQSIQRTWTLRPDGDAKFVGAAARSSHDPVASIGRVLGDRSVLYKYLSPNIVLLTAKSGSTITMYLVDAVTGAVLHTAKHHGILPGTPIPAVVSENWFVYSFTSLDPVTMGISTQLITSELFESSTPNDRGSLSARTNYSSFSPDAGVTPYVASQAFTLAEQISHLTVTQTVQGITTRQLLAVLPNSNAIIGIPRDFVNPRRTVDRDPTAVEVEEGLSRYSPILDLEPKLFLTHSREVSGIKKVITSPTLLESTSLVFAFGHDIFGTQVSPSMAFDILGKGFNKIQLILTIVALFIGVMAIRPFARQKTVVGRWKM